MVKLLAFGFLSISSCSFIGENSNSNISSISATSLSSSSSNFSDGLTIDWEMGLSRFSSDSATGSTTTNPLKQGKESESHLKSSSSSSMIVSDINDEKMKEKNSHDKFKLFPKSTQSSLSKEAECNSGIPFAFINLTISSLDEILRKSLFNSEKESSNSKPEINHHLKEMENYNYNYNFTGYPSVRSYFKISFQQIFEYDFKSSIRDSYNGIVEFYRNKLEFYSSFISLKSIKFNTVDELEKRLLDKQFMSNLLSLVRDFGWDHDSLLSRNSYTFLFKSLLSMRQKYPNTNGQDQKIWNGILENMESLNFYHRLFYLKNFIDILESKPVPIFEYNLLFFNIEWLRRWKNNFKPKLEKLLNDFYSKKDWILFYNYRRSF